MRLLFRKLIKKIRCLGPGVITGAADDDPSGIATYTQTGAQFGFGQLWTAVFVLPLMVAIQEACGRIGAATGRGLAVAFKSCYGRKTMGVIVLLLLITNTINIGADLGAMAAVARLIVPINFAVLAAGFALLILFLEIFLRYRAYARVLKWLALSLVAYPLTLFIVNAPWSELLVFTFWPHFEFNFAFFFILTGVLGTTISPYLFFWQASEEVEEERVKRLLRNNERPAISRGFISRLRWDNFFGMLFSQIAMWCIIAVAGIVLHRNGVFNVATAADAARALEPLVQTFPHAGLLAKMIFAVGIIGLGLLGIPVLAGSAAYACSELFGWREGLDLKLKTARGFYGVIICATGIGLLINFIGIDPIRALVAAAVLNGIVSIPLIFFIGRIARNKKLMGEYASGWFSNSLVWLVFGLMSLSAIGMLFAFVSR